MKGRNHSLKLTATVNQRKPKISINHAKIRKLSLHLTETSDSIRTSFHLCSINHRAPKSSIKTPDIQNARNKQPK